MRRAWCTGILISSQMQAWMDQYPVAFGLVYFVFLWLLVLFVISLLGGWFSLSRKFRYRGKFSGPKWAGVSGWMRGMAHYGNCLVIGANPDGLYLAMIFLFRFAHPPMFIPWNEVTFSRKRILFINFVRFELGRENPVPLSIRESLASKLKIAAGNGWPIESLG